MSTSDNLFADERPRDTGPEAQPLRREPLMTTPMRTVLLRAMLALFGTALGFALVIVALIVRSGFDNWEAAEARTGYICQDVGFCHYKPGPHPDRAGLGTSGTSWSFHVNTEGFRGPDIPVKRTDPRTLRVQIFGDSMIFGSGVDDDENLRAALERSLADVTGCPVEVQDYGMPMNYLESNLIAAEAFGARYDPDLLLFAISQISPKDMNYRLTQIENSAVMRWLFERDWGRWVINQYQQSTADFFFASSAKAAVTERLKRLSDQAKETGRPALAFFTYFYPDDAFLRLNADLDGIPYTWVPSVAAPPYLEREELHIEGDGHPNPEGHAFYGTHLAGHLAELLPTCKP